MNGKARTACISRVAPGRRFDGKDTEIYIKKKNERR